MREQRRKVRKTNMNNETTSTSAPVAEQGAHVAPEKTSSKKGASRKKAAPKGQKGGRGGKNKAARTKTSSAGKKPAHASTPRAESKGAKILELIGRAKGATMAEIMKSISWQAHSVRGFLSTAAKKHGLNIESTKNEAGDRTYKAIK